MAQPFFPPPTSAFGQRQVVDFGSMTENPYENNTGYDDSGYRDYLNSSPTQTTNPYIDEPVAAAPESAEAPDQPSTTQLYQTWSGIANKPEYTQSEPERKLEILNNFVSDVSDLYGENLTGLATLQTNVEATIAGKQGAEALSFGDALAEEKFHSLMAREDDPVSQRKMMDQLYAQYVEQGSELDHAPWYKQLPASLIAAGGSADAAVGAGTGAALSAWGGVTALAGGALGFGVGMGVDSGVREAGRALQLRYFANLDAGVDPDKAWEAAEKGALATGILVGGAMMFDPSKSVGRAIAGGAAGKIASQQLLKAQATTGAGRFGLQLAGQSAVVGSVNMGAEMVDYAASRALGNEDDSRLMGSLGQRMLMGGALGTGIHTSGVVIGKGWRTGKVLADSDVKGFNAKYNQIFAEENLAGAIGHVQYLATEAKQGRRAKGLTDFDTMEEGQFGYLANPDEAVKAASDLWNIITDGTEPVNFKVVDDAGRQKVVMEEGVDAAYSRQAQTVEAYLNMFRWDKEAGQRVTLNHEAAHAFMDTLPEPVIGGLRKLWEAEIENQSGPLFREGRKLETETSKVSDDPLAPKAVRDMEVTTTKGEDGPQLRDNVRTDVDVNFREWFAERMAVANDLWAKGKIANARAPKATPDGVFARLSNIFRDKSERVARRIGLRPEGLDSAFRDFLDSGDAYTFGRDDKKVAGSYHGPDLDPAYGQFLDAETKEGLTRSFDNWSRMQGMSRDYPSASDLNKANEWVKVANVEGRKRARQEVAEIDAPEAAPRMSETELATAQNRVQEIDEALAKKGLSRKERSGLRKEKNQIRQQIGESFLEVERKPRTVSPERRAEGRDTREFAEDPEGFRDQYDAGGAERTKIRKEAQEDLNKILRNRDLAAKKAEREAKAAQKQKAKEDATLKERGYTEDQKTGQLEFETRSPIDKVRAKPIKELTPDELAFEQQALRDQITSETQAQREIVREGATLKNPTDDLEFSKRGVSNAEARAQMKQRVEKAKSKKAKENALEQQQAVEDAAKRVDAENAKHPEALPLAIALDAKGNVKFDKGKVVYQSRDYDIRNHPDIKDKVDSEQTNFLAEKIVRELKTMVKNPQVKAAMGWYGRMRVKLQDLFGADIEIMAQLLGATSARTPVDENFKQALDGLSQLARGEYDNLMVRYDAHVKEVDARRDAGEFKTEAAYRKAINDFKELPLRSNGKKFNANSGAVRRVLHGHWLNMTDAPKTPNFAGNLTGRTLEATIDVWAARTMRRLLFEPQGGQWRILPASETGVGSGWAGGRGTGDFYISQRAMSEAARRLKMNPDDLQAVLWYGEKDLWDRNGWTDAAGKEKSSFDSEAGKLDLDRWNAGVTTWQTKETFDPKAQEAARVRLEASVRQNPDLVSARVVDTEGLYGGDRQSSFDIEFSVTKDSDVDTFTREVIRIGEENNQNDVFVSRVVDEDHPNARPAVEVGFKQGVSEDTLQSALRAFDKDVIDGWTIAKSRRGDIIGFRAQFIPEIEHRAAGLKMDEATVIARRDQWQASMRQAIANLDNDVVAFAREHHYDTRVYGREEYANATVAGRDTTLGAELQRRGDALRSDDSGATGNLEYSRRGANARGDGATGPVRTGKTRLDYGGRRTGSKVAEGRNEDLARAAQGMLTGRVKREEYRDLVNAVMPDIPRTDLADVDKNAVKAFLRTPQLEKWRDHLKHKNKDVDVRIDINSHKSSLKPENWEALGLEQGEPVFPVTIHEVGEVRKSGSYQAGDPLGYDTFVVLDGPLTPKFDLDRTADIAAGNPKNTIVTVSGKLAAKQKLPTNLTLKDGKRLNSRMWHQAAVQPIRSNTLYLRQADGTVGRAVRGENVETSIVHGNTVYVKFKKGTSVADRTRDLGPLEYSRRGRGPKRKTGPYAGLPSKGVGIRRSADRIARNPEYKENLKPVRDENPDIALYDVQKMRDYADNRVGAKTDLDLMEGVERLKQLTEESQNNTAMVDAFELMRRKNEAVKSAQDPKVKAQLEAELKDVYGTIAKANTTVAQLLNQNRLFKGQIESQNLVAMLDNYLRVKNRKLTTKQRKTFENLIDAEHQARLRYDSAVEQARKTNTDGDILNAIKADEAYHVASGDVQNYAKRMSPRDDVFADWRAVVSGGLLTGVSQVRNIWGNYVNLVPAVAARALATPVDIVRAKITGGERAMTIAPINELKGFTVDSWRELGRIPKKALQGARQDKIIGEAMRGFKPVEALKQVFTGDFAVDAGTGKMRVRDRVAKAAEAILGAGPEVMLRGLYVFDELAKSGARGISRAESVKRMGIKKGTQDYTDAMLGLNREIEADADKFALERTFQEDSIAAGAATSIESFVQSKGGRLGSALAFGYRVLTSPYIKTPANLAAQTISYASPTFATIEGLYHGMKAADETGVARKQHLRDAELAAGKFVIGMTLQSIAASLLEDDIITGGPDTAKKFNKMQGAAQGFFTFNYDGFTRWLRGESGRYQSGDETWRLDTMGVVGGAFAIHAETKRVKERKGENKGVVYNSLDQIVNLDQLHAMSGMGRFMMDQTMLRGVQLGLEGLMRGNLDLMGRNIVNAWGLTPAPLWNNQVTAWRATEWEYKPEVNGADTFFEGINDMISYKMGNYENLPLKRDIWGRPLPQTPEGQNPAFYWMLDIRKPQATTDQARVFLQQLYNNTRDSDIIPSYPDKKIRLPDGDELVLSPALYESYVETVQGAKLQAFSRLVSDPRWYNMGTDAAVRRLKLDMQRAGNLGEDTWKYHNGQAVYRLWLDRERQAAGEPIGN